jgi:hypothetical protein
MKAKKKSALRILKGGRDESNLSGIGPKSFLWAKATNTRLMGVVGVKVCWKLESGDIFYQFFHLDSETYGIDGYESLVNPNIYEVEYITLHMTGGLGGVFETISYNELIYLLKWSYALNIKEDEPLPEGSREFEKLLVELDIVCDVEALMDKICVHVENDAHCIHYFLMRIFGGDYAAAAFLMDSIAEDNISSNVPEGMLLRNEVSCKKKTKRGRICHAESLVDTASGYMIVHSEVNVVHSEDGYRISMAKKLEDMHVSNIEAAFLLKKPEYLAIYEIDSLDEFLMVFKIENPSMMNSIHEAGVLFTYFNKDNDHVKEDLYCLNGDIHSVYFITRADQLVVASFEKEKMEEAREMLAGKAYGEMLVENDDVLIEEPVFYEFVNSGEDDIYDFFD